MGHASSAHLLPFSRRLNQPPFPCASDVFRLLFHCLSHFSFTVGEPAPWPCDSTSLAPSLLDLLDLLLPILLSLLLLLLFFTQTVFLGGLTNGLVSSSHLAISSHSLGLSWVSIQIFWALGGLEPFPLAVYDLPAILSGEPHY